MLLAHPQGHIAPAMLAVSVGGPLLFLIGNMAFKKATTDRPLPPFSHMLGSVGLPGAGAWAWLVHLQPLPLGLARFAELVFPAVWAWGWFSGGWGAGATGVGRP